MRTILILALIFAALTGITPATPVVNCRNFEGTMLLQMTKEGCTSPVGICTVGKVESKDPTIAGANWFSTSLGTAPSAGLSLALQPASMLSYAGSVVVTTSRDGTFTTSNAGVYDTTVGAFSQLDRITSGTGKFTGSKGRLIFVTATRENEAFNTHVHGELCLTSQ